MAKRIEIKFKKGGEFTGTLLEDVTPQTCSIIWDNLPLEGLATQARYSGEEFYFKTKVEGIEPENQRMDFSLGDIVFNPEKSYRAILFYYGHNLNISMPFNPLAKIDNTYFVNSGFPFDKIKKVGERIWLKGQERIYVHRIDE